MITRSDAASLTSSVSFLNARPRTEILFCSRGPRPLRLERDGRMETSVFYVVRVVLPVLPKWLASPVSVAVIVTVVDLPGFV